MTERRAFSARLPEETHGQLDALAVRFGSKTQVIIVAVRDMFERERRKQQPRREKAMQAYTDRALDGDAEARRE